MTFIYIMVAGVFGLIFLGPAGAAIGGAIGFVYGSAQSNNRKIMQLEKEINELKRTVYSEEE